MSHFEDGVDVGLPLPVLGNGRSQTLEGLHVDKGLLDIVRGRSVEGRLLKSTVISKVLTVFRSRLFCLHQLFYLPPICRFVATLDDSDDRSVIFKLQESNSWALGGAFVGLEGEE